MRNIFFFQNLSIYEIMWKKYFRAGQAPGENMTHAYYMLGN
jgi:hypothetical protein